MSLRRETRGFEIVFAIFLLWAKFRINCTYRLPLLCFYHNLTSSVWSITEKTQGNMESIVKGLNTGVISKVGWVWSCGWTQSWVGLLLLLTVTDVSKTCAVVIFRVGWVLCNLLFNKHRNDVMVAQFIFCLSVARANLTFWSHFSGHYKRVQTMESCFWFVHLKDDFVFKQFSDNGSSSPSWQRLRMNPPYELYLAFYLTRNFGTRT